MLTVTKRRLDPARPALAVDAPFGKQPPQNLVRTRRHTCLPETAEWRQSCHSGKSVEQEKNRIGSLMKGIGA